LKKLTGYQKLTPPLDLTNQTLKVTGARGKKLAFYLPIWNIGSTPDSFLIQGSDSVTGAYTNGKVIGTYTNLVNYFLGAIPQGSLTNTPAVVAGTFSTATLAPGAFTGEATMLRAEITVDKHAPKGITTNTIKATSSGNFLKTDSVRVILTVK